MHEAGRKMVFHSYLRNLHDISRNQKNDISVLKKKIKSFFLYHGIPLLLITKKFLFSIFWRWKVRPFLSQKVDGNMIVTNC